ncbi:MAG: glycogen-binding domain-containing protein [Proteobacteria bacterium]|nr:glycoside hydrolase [Desulfobacula sp.]MBU4132181.1 glycogen-binding domain-containing protein [Pseudomonadota bacterium]
MTKGQSKPIKNRKKVEFLLYAPHASEVLLMGDFNNWKGEKHPMKKKSMGAWEKTLMLNPGNYEYKYIVDGHWQEDPANRPTRMNAFGTYNNLLTVAE